MNCRIWKSAIAGALFVALASPIWLAAQGRSDHHRPTHYYVISLGTPLGGSASGAAAINDLGWIAGDSNLTGDQAQNAVLWLYGYPINLGTLGGPNSSVLWPGLNIEGQVVGISDTAATDPNGENWAAIGTRRHRWSDKYPEITTVHVSTRVDNLCPRSFTLRPEPSGLAGGRADYRDITSEGGEILRFFIHSMLMS